jgi:hypothetical protein
MALESVWNLLMVALFLLAEEKKDVRSSAFLTKLNGNKQAFLLFYIIVAPDKLLGLFLFLYSSS